MSISEKRFWIVAVSLMLSIGLFSCSTGKLSEEKAKTAVNLLLAQGNKLPGNGQLHPIAKLLTWQGLVQISESEMNGKATIWQYGQTMTGKFIFHKTPEGKWAIDKLDFRNGDSSWWVEDVFQKVE